MIINHKEIGRTIGRTIGYNVLTEGWIYSDFINVREKAIGWKIQAS